MHHWGGKELTVGEIFYCQSEPENPKDVNAIAIFDDKKFTHKKAYLRREDAATVAQLFKDNVIKDICFLKPKSSVSKFKKRTGPMQLCNVAFLCPDDKVILVEKNCGHLQKKIY